MTCGVLPNHGQCVAMNRPAARIGIVVALISVVLTNLWLFSIGNPCLVTAVKNRFAHAQWVEAERAKPPRKWNEMILEKPFEYETCEFQPTPGTRVLSFSALGLL